MPRIQDCSNAQSKFLRNLHHHPTEITSRNIPAAAVLRRWLRKPGFRNALASLSGAMSVQADLQLSAAAASAAGALQRALSVEPEGDDTAVHQQIMAQREQIHSLVQLLRVAHVRQRFASLDSSLRACAPSAQPSRSINSADPLPGVPEGGREAVKWAARKLVWWLRDQDPKRTLGELISVLEYRVDLVQREDGQLGCLADPPK